MSCFLDFSCEMRNLPISLFILSFMRLSFSTLLVVGTEVEVSRVFEDDDEDEGDVKLDADVDEAECADDDE